MNSKQPRINNKEILISRKPPKFDSDDRFLDVPISKKNTVKLTKEQQTLVLKMIGSRESDARIVAAVKRLTGRSIRPGIVRYYRHADIYQPDRERYARQWDSAISDEDFSSKRRRLQELSDIYHDLKARGSSQELNYAASVMSKIDEIVVGKKAAYELNMQYNKYEGIPTEELIKKFKENSRILIGIEPEDNKES